MLRYAFNVREEISAKAYGRALDISTKDSIEVCRAINGKSLKKAKTLLNDLLERKRSINGRYHDKTVKNVLAVLANAEKNAEFKGLNMDKLVVNASAHKGFVMLTPRRFKNRGERRARTHIQIVLVQKG